MEGMILNKISVLALVDLVGILSYFFSLVMGILLRLGFILTVNVGFSLMAAFFLLSAVLRMVWKAR